MLSVLDENPESEAFTWQNVSLGYPVLSRQMQKLLLTMLRSLIGPQGPLKPEFLRPAEPVPCNPRRATISYYVRIGTPENTLLSMFAQFCSPSGKVPSKGSVNAPVGYETLPQQKMGSPVKLGVFAPFFIPQASALCTDSAQKSALVSFLNDAALEVFLVLVARVQALLMVLAKLSSPLLDGLVVLIEPSQPPMQS